MPEVGTLSADGSRRWDGRFWVLLRPDNPLDELPPAVRGPGANEFPWERRSFGLGSVVLAAAVGLVISYMPIPAPSPGSLESALSEMALVTELRYLCTFAAVVVILSLGRQGIDVLLLRAMLVAFILGAAFMAFILGAVFLATFPIPVTPRIPLPLVVIAGGLIWAVLLGPVIAIFAALANLLWYRSFRSLRPQLGIFNRNSVRV